MSVWILIAALPIGMLLGLMAGGSFSSVRDITLHSWYLLIPAFAIVGYMSTDRDPVGEWILLPAALVLFAIVAFKNMATVGMTIVGVGVVANLVPVLVNGDMPVRHDAVIQAGLADASNLDLVLLGAGRSFEEPDDYLVFMGAIVPVKPVKEVLTFGDLIVIAGLINVGFRAVRPLAGRHAEELHVQPANLAEAMGISESEPRDEPAESMMSKRSGSDVPPETLDLTHPESDPRSTTPEGAPAEDLFVDDLPSVVRGSATWGD